MPKHSSSSWTSAVAACLLGLALSVSACIAVVAPSSHPDERRQRRAEADTAEQKAEILRAYKDCLTRLKADPATDCQQYQKAVELLLEQPE